MSELHDLTKRVEKIEARNARVELDKKWETSWTRRLSIAILTYVIVVAFLILMQNDRPFLSALVPLGGYLLSTLAVGRIRIWWQGRLKG